MQAGLYLTLTRGLGAAEARICYEHAEPLCHSLNRPLLLYSGLMGQWVFSLVTEKMSATMQIAKRVYFTGAGAVRLCAIDRSMPRFGRYAVLSGRFRGRTTIHYAWSPDLALGRRTLSGRRVHRARRPLSHI